MSTRARRHAQFSARAACRSSSRPQRIVPTILGSEMAPTPVDAQNEATHKHTHTHRHVLQLLRGPEV
eukprot:949276-Alexandrium_andersonii.AAC.1